MKSCKYKLSNWPPEKRLSYEHSRPTHAEALALKTDNRLRKQHRRA
jgi:hypothetical protein